MVGHIQSFLDANGIVRGEVEASMKNKVYKVTIYLDDTLGIRSSECERPRGELKSSHSVALYIHAIHNLSRTDVECQWRKQKPTDDAPMTSSDLFPAPKQYNPLSRESNDDDRSWLFHELSGYGKFTGMWWLMSPEPNIEPQDMPVPIVHELLSSQQFFGKHSEERMDYFKAKMKIDLKLQEKVAKASKGQQNNEIWQMIRKGRLTASNFGPVLEAKRVTPSLMKRLLGEYDLSGVKSIVWGTQHEAEAMQQFSQCTGMEVEDTGIWLDHDGILGASPDGLIGETALLEVKCPYSLRHDKIEEGLKQNNLFLMKENDKFFLRKDHIYWHQVQGQLYLANRDICFFVVWTKMDLQVCKVLRDESWSRNLDILRKFYFDYLLPALVEAL